MFMDADGLLAYLGIEAKMEPEYKGEWTIHFGGKPFVSLPFDATERLEEIKAMIDRVRTDNDEDVPYAAECLASCVEQLHQHLSHGGALPAQWTPERVQANLERLGLK